MQLTNWSRRFWSRFNSYVCRKYKNRFSSRETQKKQFYKTLFIEWREVHQTPIGNYVITAGYSSKISRTENPFQLRLDRERRSSFSVLQLPRFYCTQKQKKIIITWWYNIPTGVGGSEVASVDHRTCLGNIKEDLARDSNTKEKVF